MATFITTMHFTEQGIKAVRDTCERASALKATAKKMGVKVTGIYWTLGSFDGVIVCEAPDEETVTAALLHLGALGPKRIEYGKWTTEAPGARRKASAFRGSGRGSVSRRACHAARCSASPASGPSRSSHTAARRPLSRRVTPRSPPPRRGSR